MGRVKQKRHHSGNGGGAGPSGEHKDVSAAVGPHHGDAGSGDQISREEGLWAHFPASGLLDLLLPHLTFRGLVVTQLVCKSWCAATRAALHEAAPRRPDANLPRITQLYPNITKVGLHREAAAPRVDSGGCKCVKGNLHLCPPGLVAAGVHVPACCVLSPVWMGLAVKRGPTQGSVVVGLPVDALRACCLWDVSRLSRGLGGSSWSVYKRAVTHALCITPAMRWRGVGGWVAP